MGFLLEFRESCPLEFDILGSLRFLVFGVISYSG